MSGRRCREASPVRPDPGRCGLLLISGEVGSGDGQQGRDRGSLARGSSQMVLVVDPFVERRTSDTADLLVSLLRCH